MTALASGEVSSRSVSRAPRRSTLQLRANRVRVIAITSEKTDRVAAGGDCRQSRNRGCRVTRTNCGGGCSAPAGLSAERIAFINAAVNKSLAGAEMKKFLENESAEAWVATPAQIADLLPREIERYRKAAKEAGIPPQ